MHLAPDDRADGLCVPLLADEGIYVGNTIPWTSSSAALIALAV